MPLLSQVLGALKKGYRIDTQEGGFPVHEVVGKPAATSNTSVHAAVTLTTAAQAVTTAISNPDVPRALIVKGGQANQAGNVVVKGLDYAGRTISEVFALNGTAAITGYLPFYAVTEIDLPARVTVGDTVSVGVSNKLGVSRPIVGAALDLLRETGTVAVPTAVDAGNGTFTPLTSPNGTVLYEVNYRTNIL